MSEMSQAASALVRFVGSWHEAVNDPVAGQEAVLRRLLASYVDHEYGRSHSAASIASVEDYRKAFPIVTYADMEPLVKRVMAGDTRCLLSEEPIAWAITRGTTSDQPKFVPITESSLATQFAAGRAVIEYALRTDVSVFQGVNLNLNFPSVIGRITVGERELEYGYSSGVYTKRVSKVTPVRSLPTQEEIDSLGGDKSIEDWNRRFELAYERCKSENVTLVGGVAPTAVLFGQYLWREHKVYPKDLWKSKVLTLGSVPGINTRYRATLRGLYGDAAVREIYGATEGILGQQRDERRAWVPNYDLFFLEVITSRGIKMLHELRPGESGSIVISTPVFARYRIGDVIVAGEAPYFRCIGREGKFTRLRYAWDSFASFDFGQI